MKKILITLALFIVAAGVSNAQWYVGGGIAIGSSNNVSNDNVVTSGTAFTFSPRVGYVFNDNVLVGVELNYSYLKSKNESNTLTSNTIGLRPYVRYNFVTMGKFAIGAEAGLEYANQKIKNDATKKYALGIDLAPVVTFAINRHLWIETKLDIFGLQYLYTTSKLGENTTTNNAFNFGIDGDSLLTLGEIKLGLVYRF